MKAQIESFIIQKSDGSSIFKIQMVNHDCKSWLNFNCTIEIDYNKHPEMYNAVSEILSPETSADNVKQITQNILEKITTIEGIKQFKLREHVNTEPSHENINENFLLDFAYKPDTRTFTPYSLRKNTSHFRKFERKMTPDLPHMIEGERSVFEELIAGHPELEEEYVNNYSAEASFHVVSVCLGEVCHQYYIMYNNGIKLFFFVEIE